jgi:hypothetical protein
MESPMTASVSSQLSKLIQMQEASSIAEAAQVKELQKELNIEMDKRVNAESQLEAVQQGYTIATEELVNQLEAANKDYVSATEELATSHIELSESRSRHAEVQQQMILLEHETKSELSTAEEAATRLEAQLEVEFDKLAAMNEVLAESHGRRGALVAPCYVLSHFYYPLLIVNLLIYSIKMICTKKS